MKNLKNEKNDLRMFNKTSSGASKFALFIMGIILGLVSSTLFGYMCGSFNATGNYQYYDWLLFVAIFLLIFTGELIGIYFGAYEEYHLMKKKSMEEKENETIKNEVKEEIKSVIKEEKHVEKKPKVSSKKTVKKTTDTKKKTSKTSSNSGKKTVKGKNISKK